MAAVQLGLRRRFGASELVAVGSASAVISEALGRMDRWKVDWWVVCLHQKDMIKRTSAVRTLA